MDGLYLEFLEPLGLPRTAPPVELRVTREGVLERLRGDSAGTAPDGGHTPPAAPADAPLLGVAPGAAFGPSKQYPNALLAAALARLHEEHGLVPLLLGSPAERALLADLHARLRIPHLSTHGRPGDLGDAKALVARCAVLLSADNGARHLAAALGVPQVVWFGPTHPEWSGYAASATRALRRAELDCIACHCPRCPRPGHPCMRGIAPAEVVAAVRAALTGAPRGTQATGSGGAAGAKDSGDAAGAGGAGAAAGGSG